MPAEPALESRGPVGQGESEIRLLSLSDVWPPLGTTAAGPTPAWRPTDGERPTPLEEPWTRQFALLLVEAMAGARPAQQVLPWMSQRGSIQLGRLLPAFRSEHRPRVLRVLTAESSPDVIEMTVIIAAGPRTRAVAVRLQRAARDRRRNAPPWLCTDVEAA
jgi:hypothetical protein